MRDQPVPLYPGGVVNNTIIMFLMYIILLRHNIHHLSYIFMNEKTLL